MPWKLGEADAIVLQDGKAVAVIDGKEVLIDPDQIYGKVKELNTESEKRRVAMEELQKKLAPWEALTVDDKPVDVEAVKSAISTVRNLKDGKLLEADKVQAIRDDAVKVYVQEVANKEAEVGKLRGELDVMAKGHAFATSKFVQDRLLLPPDMALEVFGKHFKHENGKLIGYLGDDKIPSRKTIGELADLDEALEAIVEKHPYKDRILKSDGASGSGAPNTGGNGGARGHVLSRDDARDPMKYRAAKEAAAKAGVELQIQQ
jgi:hypothetical protein